MTIKEFLKRLFSKSKNDQYRFQKATLQVLSQQDLEYARSHKKLTKTIPQEKEEFRYEIIAALFEGLHGMYDDVQYKKKSIDSFARSRMPIEEIKWYVNQVREFQNSNKTIQHPGTKLPQRSTPDHIR